MEFEYLDKIYLPVKDLERSAEWYNQHFALVRTKSSLDKRQMIMSFSETSFILLECDRINQYSHIPFNFHAKKLKEWRDRLLQNGVTVTELKKDNDMLCCDFYDVDGNRIGLVQEERQTEKEDHIEVAGTFLTVKNLLDSVKWYEDVFGFDFFYFHATGAAGYVGPTPEYVEGLTIHYAGVRNTRFQSEQSRMGFVETPEFNPLVHVPFTLQIADSEKAYQKLSDKGVQLTDFYNDGREKGFCFYDCNGHRIGIEEKKESVVSVQSP